MNWVPDPNDPTVPYSQQRLMVIYYVGVGLTTEGVAGSPREMVDNALAEACDHGKAYPLETNPWWQGKPGRQAEEADLVDP